MRHANADNVNGKPQERGNTMKKELAMKVRNDYPVGTRIVLICMNDPFSRIPSGTLGTVRHVDDMGTIHMSWDNGSSLGLIIGEDLFRKI